LLSRRRLNPDATGELDTDQPDIKFEPKVGTGLLMTTCIVMFCVRDNFKEYEK